MVFYSLILDSFNLADIINPHEFHEGSQKVYSCSRWLEKKNAERLRICDSENMCRTRPQSQKDPEIPRLLADDINFQYI